MRTILFRGRSIYDNTWVFGSLLQDGNHCSIVSDGDPGIEFTVNPDSVGQQTPFVDDNGKFIWEGDVLDVVFKDGRMKTILVRWRDWSYGFAFYERNGDCWLYVPDKLDDFSEWYVIGNVFENNWGRRG